MSNYIKYFDLFSTNVTLYTKSYSKVWTYLGFSCTSISVILFCFIFYLEAYEVFKLDHPNVILYKQNLNRNNSTLSINNSTFNFYINLNLDFPKEILFNHLIVSAMYRLNANSDTYIEKVILEECNSNDEIIFEKLFKREIKLVPHGVNLCPRIDFDKIKDNTNISNFNFLFSIHECDGFDKACIPDSYIYENLNSGKLIIEANLNFVDSQIDPTDYDKPYWLKFEELRISTDLDKKRSIIKLEGSEINTQSLFSFHKLEKKSQFSILSSETSKKQPRWKTFLSYEISFNSKDMYIYNRTYKTLNSAFANSFAIFKLITWLVSVILSPYYNYCKNTYIINKNFDYEKTVQANNNTNVNSLNTECNDLTFTASMINNRKPKNLTIGTVVKNVSLIRYAFCLRRNKTRVFYKQALFVIRHSLSIENIFSSMVDYFRLKRVLLDHKDINSVNELERKLVVNSDLEIKEDILKLDVLISNSENKPKRGSGLNDSINK
jgi:hypothetical protein